MDQLLNVIPTGFVRVNLKGEITFANEIACQILDLSINELSHTFYQSTDFGQIGLDGKPMNPSQLPLAIAMTEQRAVKDLVHGITNPNTKELRWLSVSAAPELENGALKGAVASFVDITDRIKKDQIYRKIIENSTDMICFHKPDGIYEYVNPAARRLLGYEVAELIGRNPYDLLHPQDEKRVREIGHGPALQGLADSGIRYRIKRKDGSYIWIQSTIYPITDPAGNVTGLQSISRDVGQDVQREQEILRARLLAEKASQAKSEFIANMSHDIRTPIHGILGLTEVLLESCESDSQQEMLEMVDRSAHQLLNIINDLLDVSKLEAGAVQLRFSWFSLETLIQSLESLYVPEARKQGLNITSGLSGQQEGYLLGDESRIIQVVGNLISNAIRYTKEGSVHLAFSCSPTSKDHRTLTVSVEDTGPGIPLAEQQRIFDRFVHLDVGPERSKGAGLGLSIAQLLLREMGGEIFLESEPGHGSRFTIQVELEHRDSLPDMESRIVDDPARSICTRPLKLLLAEDAPENRVLLNRFLEHTCWDLDFAEDGLEALEKAKKNDYDIMLLDISMPELDGLQVAQELRRRYNLSERKLPPLIALTAYGSSEDFEQSRKAGFSLHLTKPFSKNKLIRAIASVLEGNGSRDYQAVHG
ncbi:MAG: hypothetical protein CMF59_03555 [Leptospiraceae bacterium]|nr:hypothetical protein [Leptospiraceae bacterium]